MFATIRCLATCLAGLALLAPGRARADALTFVGSDGGDWETAANWEDGSGGNKVPTASDDVTIDGKWVKTAGSVAAKSILVKGSAGALTVAGTAKNVAAQTAVSDLSATVALTVSGDLVVNGGKFSIGAQAAPYNISATIGGDLVVTNGAVAAFHSGETSDLDILEAADLIAKLYANANVVTVGGTFLVGAGSTVYHESNRLSGTPVIFKVRDFTQEAGGVNTAVGRGWAKVNNPSTVPLRSLKEGTFYSYALGQGWSYNAGSGHGAKSGASWSASVTYVNQDGSTKSMSFTVGNTYGYEFAPFLPGSPNGCYNSSSTTRASGAICIWASGTATVAGTLTTKGNESYYGAPSAGSIWLAARRFAVARTASLVAEGGKCKGGYGSSGGAGRVAFAVGLTDAQLAQLAANTQPADLSLRSADVSGIDCNVLGGYANNGAWRSASGTAKFVWSTDTIPFEVAGTPGEYSTATPAYGWHALPATEVPSSFTTAESSVSPSFYRGLRRYTNAGVVVTDEDTVIPLAEIAGATGRVKVTHQWTTIEDCIRVRIVGGGSVTIGGAARSADTDLWQVAGSTVTATATAGSGTFVRWVGEFTNGVSTASTITPALIPGLTLYAVFSDASAAAKSYSGASGGFWDVASNWTPAGVPTPVDDVTIGSGSFVKSYGLAAAGSLTLSGGKLAVGGMNEPAIKVTGLEIENKYCDLQNQAKPTDYDLSGSGLCVGGALSLTGAAELSVGAYRQTAPHWCIRTDGDLSLAGTSRATVYAKAYDGVLNDSGKIDLTNHYHQATVVRVGGNLTLADTAWVVVESEAVTGAPVKWQVAGGVTVGASTGFDATGRGYNWINYSAEGYTDPRYLAIETLNYTLGPGYGTGYVIGGGYGGSHGTSYGKSYGFDVAPYLAGSPSGGSANYNIIRGGGAIWIVCENTFELNGTLIARGGRPYSTGTGGSGGGIWVAAKKFRTGSGATLNAKGGYTAYAVSQSGGCGGRICVAEGVSAEQLDILATGTRPDELTYGESIAGATTTVAGGYCRTDSTTGEITYAPAGTIVKITGEASEFPLEISSQPVKCTAEGLDYSPQTVERGVAWSMTIADYGYDPADAANVRYACASWVISNTVGEVAHGTGSTASFTPEKGPFTLTWTWNDRHVRHAVNVPEHATMTVNGTDYATATSVWIAEATPVKMTVTPEAGYELLCWEGPISFGKARSFTLDLPAGTPNDVTPVVRAEAEATTRTWAGGTGHWWTESKWSPSGIPGTNDTLVIGSGTCIVSNFLECGALKLSGAAALKVAETAKTGLEEAALVVHGDLTMTNTATLLVSSRSDYRHGRLAVEGDLLLLGTNTLTVSAGPTNLTDFTCAKGAGWVTVGRDFTVGGKSTVVPNSAPWTGGSVVFRVGHDFTLTTNAAFRANDNGYQRVAGRNPVSLAPGIGCDYQAGAGHGGYGTRPYDWPTTSYGQPYGFEYAPVEPGSPCGNYADHPGGGLVRIHAARRVTLAGEINVNARAKETDASSASGGGIWVTAGVNLIVADGAILKARGGYRCTGYGAKGGGGRIALGKKLTTADVESLAATGGLESQRKLARCEQTLDFLAEHPNVTIDVRGGEDLTGDYEGTFRYLCGRERGFKILFR